MMPNPIHLTSWWHRVVLHHEQENSRVTVLMMDTSWGVLRKCSCGEVWAL